jgi:TPR repeat protein
MMRRLADGGDVDAMEKLGLWHLYGSRLLGPGPWNRSEAVRWLTQAAEHGRPVAQYLLGRPVTAELASR